MRMGSIFRVREERKGNIQGLIEEEIGRIGQAGADKRGEKARMMRKNHRMFEQIAAPDKNPNKIRRSSQPDLIVCTSEETGTKATKNNHRRSNNQSKICTPTKRTLNPVSSHPNSTETRRSPPAKKKGPPSKRKSRRRQLQFPQPPSNRPRSPRLSLETKS